MKIISIIICSCVFFGLSLNSIITLEFWCDYDYIISEVCLEKDVVDSCCKGSCHLTKELSKAENSDSSKEISTVHTTPLLNWFKTEVTNVVNSTASSLLSEGTLYNRALCSGIPSSIDHPPRRL